MKKVDSLKPKKTSEVGGSDAKPPIKKSSLAEESSGNRKSSVSVGQVKADSRSTGKGRDTSQTKKYTKEKIVKLLAYSSWVVVAFYGAQLLMSLLVFLLVNFNLRPAIGTELESFLVSALIFALTLVILIFIPAKIFKSPLRGRILDILGLKQRLPKWRDIGLAIVAYISCFAAAIGLAIAVQVLIPGFDMNQAQSLPFDQTQFYAGLSLVWIYLTLGVAAPVGEELIFRGYLFGKLRKIMPASITIVVTAIVFSMLHVVGVSEDGSFNAQWNVVVAILPLSIGLGILREYTGSVWASIILHSIQNSISFALLFVVLPAQGLF